MIYSDQPGNTLTVLRLRGPLISNCTRPFTLAYSVSSLPMPTFVPGWNRVPRWRTNILPASTCSPAKRLTPSHCECESRPLRELPPAFLCAIAAAPCLSIGRRRLGRCRHARDRGDLELGIILPVPGGAAVIFPAAEFKDADLLAAPVTAHLRGYRRLRQQRVADA